MIRWDAASGELETAKSLLRESERAVAEMTGHLSAATTKQVEAASCLPQQRQEEAEAAAALQRLKLERDSLGEEEKRIDVAHQETKTRLSQISQDMEREHNLISDSTAAIVRLENEHENYSREGNEQNEVMEKASLTLKAAQGSFESLNGESFGASIAQELDGQGIKLSEASTVWSRATDEEWLITDTENGLAYVIKNNGGDKLEVN